MSDSQSDDDPFDGLDLLIPKVRRRSSILFQIEEELNKESDRGCALVAAAYLENELTELLTSFFVKQSLSEHKSLFDFNGPVGTFSSKIRICFALGLISKEICLALDLVRKIRNEFAHLQSPLHFEENKIKQRIIEILPEVTVSSGGMRELFISKLKVIIASLHFQIASAVRRQVPEHVALTTQENKEAHDLDIAARHLMNITAPDITYEQALELAKEYLKIKA